MQVMRVHAGSCLFNAVVHDEMSRSKSRVDAMVELLCTMNKNLSVESIVYTISKHAQKLTNADKCTMYVCDRAANELWTLDGSVNLKYPMDKGLTGYVASKGETINMEDPYNDPRFDQEGDKKKQLQDNFLAHCASLWSCCRQGRQHARGCCWSYSDSQQSRRKV